MFGGDGIAGSLLMGNGMEGVSPRTSGHGSCLVDRGMMMNVDAMASRILEYCRRSEARLAVAESLTGGLLADAFVRIPGASTVFLGAAVTYDIRAKMSILHVDRALLERTGAVDPEVARQMAVGVAQLYEQPRYRGRVFALSTTGVAGPGPDGDKPAGLVYVALAIPAAFTAAGRPRVEAHRLQLAGGREDVRRATVLGALGILSKFIEDSQE